MFSNPIGQVLRSRCHLYWFSFSKPPARLCPLTRGGAARLLGGNPRSACGLKGVLPRRPAARLAPSRALWGQAVPCTFPFSNAFGKRKRRLCLCQSTHKDALVSMCGIVPPRGHAVKVLRMFVKVSQIPRKTPPFLAQCCKNSLTPLAKNCIF